MSEQDTKGNALAARLRLAREQAGLSQGQVAKMLGLHRPSVSEAEAGRRKVSSDEIAELARIYAVDVAWLVGSETRTSDQVEDRVALAARELAKLQPADLDRLLSLLGTLRTQEDADR